jgi:hypothetical protein
MKGSARVETSRERDAHTLTNRNMLEDGCHGVSMIIADRFAQGAEGAKSAERNLSAENAGKLRNAEIL